jgi:hypothetical protein
MPGEIDKVPEFPINDESTTTLPSELERGLVCVGSKRLGRGPVLKALTASFFKSPLRMALTQVAREVVVRGASHVLDPSLEESEEAPPKVEPIIKPRLDLSINKPWSMGDDLDFATELMDQPDYPQHRIDWPRTEKERVGFMKILLGDPFKRRLLEFYTGEGYQRLPYHERFQVFKRLITYYRQSLDEFRKQFPFNPGPKELIKLEKHFRQMLSKGDADPAAVQLVVDKMMSKVKEDINKRKQERMNGSISVSSKEMNTFN